MNKIISTKERKFISLVGPSGSGKLNFFFDWLKIVTFQPKFDKNFVFINFINLLMNKCKENLCHQRKMGRDVELQNTQTVFFKSPRDVLPINSLSQQLSLGSQLKEWYQDATSTPYGHLLIDLTPKTLDSLRYCTNSGSVQP